MSLAQTATRTESMTVQLIVMQGTVGPTITQVVWMQASARLPAQKQAWAGHVFTVLLILALYAIIHSVTACEHR